MYPRIPALAFVALALAAALAAGCRAAPAEPSPGPSAAGDEISHFTCSMHPSVKNAEPGSCPLCAMALMPVRQQERESGEIVLDEGRRQRIGVTTAKVERRPLTVRVRAVGKVTYDQSRLTDVTLKVGGWIDELHADRVGQRVRRGEPLFTLYSPDLLAAQEDYLVAVESEERAGRVGSTLGERYLLEARQQRLRLFDLGPDQIRRLEESGVTVERVEIPAPASGYVIEKNVVAGAAVSPGMRLLRIAGLDRVWVEAEVYESELSLLSVGDAATVTLPHLPGRSFEGKIAFIYPWLDDATRTGRVRIELPNPDLALKPEMYAEVVFEPALGERLAVPEEAILYAGERRYVFVDLGGGRLRPQAVTLGQRASEWLEVLDGLAPGDEVVTSGNFLIAAEARLKLALDHWTPAENGAAPAETATAHGDGIHAAHAGDHGAGGHDSGGHADHGDPDGHAGHPAPAPAAAAAPAAGGNHAGHGDHGAPEAHDAAPAHAEPDAAAGHDAHDDHRDHGAAADHRDHGAAADHGDHGAAADHGDHGAAADHGDHGTLAGPEPHPGHEH